MFSCCCEKKFRESIKDDDNDSILKASQVTLILSPATLMKSKLVDKY